MYRATAAVTHVLKQNLSHMQVAPGFFICCTLTRHLCHTVVGGQSQYIGSMAPPSQKIHILHRYTAVTTHLPQHVELEPQQAHLTLQSRNIYTAYTTITHIYTIFQLLVHMSYDCEH